jgi:hypothetical protein
VLCSFLFAPREVGDLCRERGLAAAAFYLIAAQRMHLIGDCRADRSFEDKWANARPRANRSNQPELSQIKPLDLPASAPSDPASPVLHATLQPRNQPELSQIKPGPSDVPSHSVPVEITPP